jgi:CBS domain-containing protein
MIYVTQILKNKENNDIFAINSNQTVFEALEKMAEKKCGALLVMDDERLVGIFSERDYARKGVLQNRKAKTTAVREVMTSGVYSVAPTDDFYKCMQLMYSKKVRYLPVLERENVIGVLSISDVLTTIFEEQQIRLKLPEQYMSGY